MKTVKWLLYLTSNLSGVYLISFPVGSFEWWVGALGLAWSLTTLETTDNWRSEVINDLCEKLPRLHDALQVLKSSNDAVVAVAEKLSRRFGP